MKPTPALRLHWWVAGLVAVGTAGLLWGCGHTREIVHPPRKVSPPRVVRSQIPASKLEPVEPTEPITPVVPELRRQPDAPTAIDVPLIDRSGR